MKRAMIASVICFSILVSARLYLNLEIIKSIRTHDEADIRVKKEVGKRKKYLGTFRTTAYCACESCSGGWGTKIAYKGDGHTRAKVHHTIAVDPDVIPLGTKVKIEGFGNTTFVAEDVGGGVKGKHIDIYFSSHEKVDDYNNPYEKVYKVK